MKPFIVLSAGAVAAASIAAAGWLFWPAGDQGTGSGLADQVRPTDAVTVDRAGPASQSTERDLIHTAAVAALTYGDIEVLEAALVALDDGDVALAREHRNALPDGSVDRQLATWAIAMSGNSAVTAREIDSARRALADWPGHETLDRHHERALARGLMSPVRLRAAFADRDPVTFEAAHALARSHLTTGDSDGARDLILPHWHSEPLPGAVEVGLADRFGDLLTQEDHRIRYINMMSRDRIRAAARIAEAADMGGLHNAWAAVIRRTGQADQLVAAIPEPVRQTEAGLYVRTKHLRQSRAFEDAAALIVQFDEGGGAMTNADAWWNERRIVSRSLRERGDVATAYAIVAAHRGGRDTTAVDAAFHAGWYALQGLGDPDLAEQHFARIEQIARGASSRARAAYWMARAAEARGDDDAARSHHERAARYPTVFYGQLAADALGHDRLVIAAAPDADPDASLTHLPAFAALDRLAMVDQQRRLRTLSYGLADMFDDPARIAAVIAKASAREDHFTALRTAKRAAWRGVDLGALTHPVGAIPGSAELSPADRALAYAIARQESEFNTHAISRADARGLLQLLPSTARAVADRMELAYAPGKLTEDPAFNALLGTRYLDEQRDRFGGSYILTFIAYNAGPGRAREWLARFGDPRGLSLEETIDWIEQIPFPETRNYVQKVMENLTVYKAQFDLPLEIDRDLRSNR